jgi:predicted metal-dependent TIM-barrel fold hydrolase
MEQDELLQMLEQMEKHHADRKEVNAMIFMELNHLSDKELEWIKLQMQITKTRPAVVKLPNGDERKLKWEGLK